jgi:hypothetical protein
LIYQYICHFPSWRVSTVCSSIIFSHGCHTRHSFSHLRRGDNLDPVGFDSHSVRLGISASLSSVSTNSSTFVYYGTSGVVGIPIVATGHDFAASRVVTTVHGTIPLPSEITATPLMNGIIGVADSLCQ